jgi:nucleotide-binding universal stress UspA family protein
MAIKRILLPLDGSARHAAETNLAVSVAKAMPAHIEALFIHQSPLQRRTRPIDSGMYYAQGSAALAVQTQPLEETEPHAQEAREQLASACAANGIPVLHPGESADLLPSAAWRETEGSYVSTAAQRAAAFDLVIAAGATVAEPLKDIAEQSLLGTGRPVLLAPSQLNTKLTDEAIIAWDESPQCWHAISAAVPFLTLAQSVRVLSVDRDAESRRVSQEEVLAYLRCHGIGATAQVIGPQSELHSVGDILLAAAAEHESGLLVMGAYSRSRLREMLFGGATHYILRNASARPVLMAH